MDTSARMLDSERLLMMAIELDQAPETVWAAIDDLADAGLERVREVVRRAPARSRVAADAWQRAVTPERLRALVDAEPPDLAALETVLDGIGAADASILLDLLTESDSLATRKRLFDRLVELAPALHREIVRRLRDERWHARRNMLALLGALDEWPPKWDPVSHAEDPHPAVRREACKLMLRVPRLRSRAITGLLEDRDRRAISLGLAAATEFCPPEAVIRLAELVSDETLPAEFRVMGIRALGQSEHPEVEPALLEIARRDSRFGRNRVAEASPVVLAALRALATLESPSAAGRKLLARAVRSNDPEIRAAVGSRGT